MPPKKKRKDWSEWLQETYEEIQANTKRFYPATIKARRNAIRQLAQKVGKELKKNHGPEVWASARRTSWDKLVRPFTTDETGCPANLAEWKMWILDHQSNDDDD